MRKIRKVRSNHNDLFNYFIYDEKCLSKKYVSKCVLFLDNLTRSGITGRIVRIISYINQYLHDNNINLDDITHIYIIINVLIYRCLKLIY